jgi:serine protease Do
MDSLDPGMKFDTAPAGQYDVWVGSYNRDDSVSGVLALVDGDGIDLAAAEITGLGDGLDFAASPYFGSTELSAGFTPDPHTVTISAGGSVDVSAAQYGNECNGYASSAPDYQLNWSGDSESLQLYFVAVNITDDATLIINNPDGMWLCNDDSPASLNPGVTINNPGAGRYDIWVGSYAQGEFISGDLNITELMTDVP